MFSLLLKWEWFSHLPRLNPKGVSLLNAREKKSSPFLSLKHGAAWTSAALGLHIPLEGPAHFCAELSCAREGWFRCWSFLPWSFLWAATAFLCWIFMCVSFPVGVQAILSHAMSWLNGFRKSIPLQNRQVGVCYYLLKQRVDGFVGRWLYKII